MILVGPQNDHGWSQAHFEAGQYVIEQLGLRRRRDDRARQGQHGRPSGHHDRGRRRRHGGAGCPADLRHVRRHARRDHRRRRRPPRRADDLVVGRQRLGRRTGLRAGPHQPRQRHGADGVRQDDRRLRRRADHADRPHRLPRTADQRRDAPPRQLGVPRCPPLLGDVPRRGPGGARVRGQVDRLLVQHPRLHARPDPGDQRVPRQRRRRRHLRHRHHRGDRARRSGGRVGRGRVGGALRLPRRLRRSPRRLPRRSVLQLGPVVPRASPSRSSTTASRRRGSGSARTGRTSTTPTRAPSGGSTGRR